MPLQTRISNIDLLRGIVMVIMALDHTRDFIHMDAFTEDPLNLQTTTPVLFFTRWITHLCAPTFVFLSGMSIYMQSLRKKKSMLSSFLLKRGIWLIILEILIVTFGISFDPKYSILILQVIWAIGISMVLLSGIIRLPFYLILALGIIIVAGHNLLDIYEAGRSEFPLWYQLAHRPGEWQITRETVVLIFYPFLPWTGIMILGYCFGRFYLSDVMNRHRRSILLGAGLLVFFVLLRYFNSYGDPIIWKKHDSFLYTLLSFLDTQKYPPSLLYCSVTIGISLIVLGLSGDLRNRFTRMIEVFGQVPLFYYVIHFYLIHAISAALYLARGHSWAQGITGLPGLPFKFIHPGEGYSLWIVYLVWFCVLAVMYPLCSWYAGYKLRSRQWWLSYL